MTHNFNDSSETSPSLVGTEKSPQNTDVPEPAAEGDIQMKFCD
jgi:hypothetical protein